MLLKRHRFRRHLFCSVKYCVVVCIF